ncbi:hypothetical protein PVAND_013869 [Polypedilum vanderplanki]|uniref:Uncharacterized protein n=1 Tax=Polypedilum vanderplanki TaxID=319348 RepID=A0A9J6CSV2_POLVA|nr:hypothetical protein PVAND_013869 [Polypedilum vanderplanki]
MFDVRGDVAHYIFEGAFCYNVVGERDLIGDDPFCRRFRSLVCHQADRIELHVSLPMQVKKLLPRLHFLSIEYHGFRESALVMAKAKVTPLKKKTKSEISQMPRLEVTSCLIAARMAKTILDFHPHLVIHRFLWTDSTIALSWIKNPNCK